jgi:O-methyltransferase
MREIKDFIPQIDDLPTRRRENFPELTDSMFWQLYATCSQFSMMQVTGFYNLFQSMRYIADRKLRGDIVECGCFLGGASVFIGLMRRMLNMENKTIYLCDTFEGPPEGIDDLFLGTPQRTGPPLPNYHQSVRELIVDKLGEDHGFVFVPGKVEDTLPSYAKTDLSLIRLDTDYYSSTRVELEVLYPMLVKGGVVIIDDYGYYQGARQATDQYFGNQKSRPLLNRIDNGVWAGVKP